MLWIDKYQGFMADVPDITFIRCDGTAFSYDTLTSASMTHNHNTITITGGTGSFPLAYIDTDSSLEFTFECAEFNLDIFEMANAVSIDEGDFGSYESGRYAVETGGKITLPFEVKANSIKIRGLVEDSTAAAGKFSVSITASTASVEGKTEITFHNTDASVGDTIRVVYQRRIVSGARVPVLTTSTTAKGSLYANWNIKRIDARYSNVA